MTVHQEATYGWRCIRQDHTSGPSTGLRSYLGEGCPQRGRPSTGPMSDIISETELIQRHPWIGRSRLKAVIRRGEVPYLKGQRGTRWYGPTDVEAVIDHFRSPCQNLSPEPTLTPSSRSADSGSEPKQIESDSTVTGISQELRRFDLVRPHNIRGTERKPRENASTSRETLLPQNSHRSDVGRRRLTLP